MKPSQNANRGKLTAAVFVAALLASGVVSAKGSEPLLAFIPLGSSQLHFSPITWAAVATSTKARSKPQAAGTAKTAPIPVPGAVLGASVSAAEAVTRAELTAQLDQLSESLRSQFLTITSSGPSFSGPAASTPVTFQSFASSQRIDQLSGTDLTNVTVSGVSGLTDSDIPDGITAANYLPLIGGTLTGNLTLSGVLSAGSLLVSTISSGGAVEAPYFTATSTTASSTFPNLNATNATTTNATSTNQYATALVAGNATSTNFFSTLGRFTTGIFDTLLTAASASITNLTATTLTATNATTTRLDALEYVAVGGSATTTIRGDGAASTIPYASSTAITVSGTASTSNLIASTGFTFKTVTGFLKASAGIVSEALVDLAANVTGILPVANGGTGWAAIQTGTIPYGNGSSALATSSTLTFDGTKLVATYASTTALTTSGSAYFATSAGNVGIGTTSPASTLTVSNTSAAPASAASTWDTTGGQLTIDSTAANATDGGSALTFRSIIATGGMGGFAAIKGGIETAANNNGYLSFLTRTNAVFATERMRITSAGNVGIGTTTPGKKLDVVGTTQTSIRVSDTGGAALELYQQATDSYLLATNALRLYTGGAERLHITAAGNVGIGESSPAYRLHVSGSGDMVNINSSGGSGTYFVRFATGGSGSGTLIGTISQNGASAVAYNTTSDRRVKENIDYTKLGLDTLVQLPVREFSFTADETHATTTGFIAQELYEVFPWAVTTNGDNGIDPLTGSSTPWSVDYGRITPLLTKAIQDIASIGDTFKNSLIAWLADAGNGITAIFAKKVQTAQLCAEKSDGTTFCVTGDQLANVLSGASSIHSSEPVASADPGTSTPPTITIAGENPATIRIGDTYNDLGAIATDSEGHELSYRTFINGILSGDILIDTSHEATDTIDYVATDTWGNTATSTRTVIVEAVAAMVTATDASTSTSSGTSSPLSE